MAVVPEFEGQTRFSGSAWKGSMRIQAKTILIFASPLLLAIIGAYVHRIFYGLQVITVKAQPPPVGEPKGFPGLVARHPSLIRKRG